MTQKRRFDRIHFDAECELHVKGQRPKVVQLHDISLHGALVESTPALDMMIGDKAELILYLSNDVMINMPSSLRSTPAPKLYGFEAESLDIDSMAHLRRLIELNLGSEDLLHRNLEARVAN